jgi:putative protein-disulfide isomerase
MKMVANSPLLTLHYIHDPMCSWCWAFRPAWQRVRQELPPGTRVENLLGGLAPDTDRPMPEEMRKKIRAIWNRIEAVVPGTEFNHGFWERCRPRRSTYPACRAVIAATAEGPEFEEPMILAIQRAYYREARNPSDGEVLVDLAASLGLDPERFAARLQAPATVRELARQIETGRRLGATGFPSLIATGPDGTPWPIGIDYTHPEAMLRRIQNRESIAANTQT